MAGLGVNNLFIRPHIKIDKAKFCWSLLEARN